MRDSKHFSRALAGVTLITAGVTSVILAACGGYGGSSSYGGGGGGMSCGSGYSAMCPPPTVTLTAPAAGAVSGTVTMSATAAASSTYSLTVTKVDFLVDGAVVGTAMTAPYTFMWVTTHANDGSHMVTAAVTDSKGGTATSSAVTITITTAAAAMVSMSAAQIFPAPMSQGMGMGNLNVKFETGAVRGTVKLAGVNATAVSINQGFAGTTGAAVIRLAPSGGNGGEWQVPAGALLTAEQLGAFSQGQLYLIATSATYPRGEVRGQIVPAGVVVTFSAMTPMRDARSLRPGTAGVIATTVNKSALTVSVHVNSNGVEDADAARVVSSATGRTLAVLAKDPVDMGHWSAELATIGAAEVQHFEAGQWNVSIATPVETHGALQGAISAEAR